MGSRDERIATIARLQRGRVARRQLVAAGISSAAVGRALTAGRLLRVHRGVYVVPGSETTTLGRETAALLAVRDGALLSHHTAAALWGLRLPVAEDIHVLVAGGPAAAVRGVQIHRTHALEPDDARIVKALLVTSPARTIIDLAPHLADRRLEFTIDQAITEKLVRPAQLRRALERLTHAAGRRRVLELLDDGTRTTITRSHAEERLLALVRDGGLPDPLVNTRVLGYEVDFYWPQARLVVEVDGFRFHSTHQRFERDRNKDAVLQAAGVGTMRVTPRGLEREGTAIVVRIGQAIALRGGPGGV
ncbi:MAG: type IV toxin-antitoxin system AbiEi family antitoxin domain-containing protein [Solirubrobacteraceae bacterium]